MLNIQISNRFSKLVYENETEGSTKQWPHLIFIRLDLECKSCMIDQKYFKNIRWLYFPFQMKGIRFVRYFFVYESLMFIEFFFKSKNKWKKYSGWAKIWIKVTCQNSRLSNENIHIQKSTSAKFDIFNSCFGRFKLPRDVRLQCKLSKALLNFSRRHKQTTYVRKPHNNHHLNSP